MKILIIGVCLLVLMNSCGGGKPKAETPDVLTENVDSLAALADSLEAMEPVEEEPVLPPAADESFADFFYNFATDERLQKSRIVFPLPYYEQETPTRIEKADWKHDSLFSVLEAYTVIFDSVDDIGLEKDTALTSVKVEWIYLTTGKMKRYYFERLQGRWKLEAIDYADIPKEESDKEDFYEFYQRFVTDSVFQASRLHEPLRFVAPDPEDEFQIMETILEPGQWFAFQPVLPREVLTNVNYGQNDDINSNTKVIEMKGFGNGFNNTLYFRRYRGEWKLVQFEDLSD